MGCIAVSMNISFGLQDCLARSIVFAIGGGKPNALFGSGLLEAASNWVALADFTARFLWCCSDFSLGLVRFGIGLHGSGGSNRRSRLAI